MTKYGQFYNRKQYLLFSNWTRFSWYGNVEKRSIWLLSISQNLLLWTQFVISCSASIILVVSGWVRYTVRQWIRIDCWQSWIYPPLRITLFTVKVNLWNVQMVVDHVSFANRYVTCLIWHTNFYVHQNCAPVFRKLFVWHVLRSNLIWTMSVR